MQTIQLPITFDGTGEVAGSSFRLAKRTNTYLIYKVYNLGSTYYEVFKIKCSPVCLDFQNRIYSETEQKEVYPKSKQFGITAWTTSTKQRAIEIGEALAFRTKPQTAQGS